jgi:hypothetical protein
MDLPEMKPVDSSMITAVGYEELEQLLYVRFKGGSTYEYRYVPVNVYENLMNAESIGSYLKRMIQGAYLSKKVE